MKSLVKKIKQVTKYLLDMAYRSEEAVSFSLKSLFENDEMLARKVIEGDDKIDTLENKIDRMCLNIFALNQPVAVDLRSVLMISKINSDFERIADMACNIAERSINIYKKVKDFKLYPEKKIQELGVKVQKMLKLAIESYIEEDSTMARDCILQDNEVNELHNEILKDLVEKSVKDPKNISIYLDLVAIVKSVERIGDHVTNICEDVIFIETGETVKHKRFN